jgi:hypothetical protein
MSEDRCKIKIFASGARKGAIYRCWEPPKGSPKAIPCTHPPGLPLSASWRNEGGEVPTQNSLCTPLTKYPGLYYQPLIISIAYQSLPHPLSRLLSGPLPSARGTLLLYIFYLHQ